MRDRFYTPAHHKVSQNLFGIVEHSTIYLIFYCKLYSFQQVRLFNVLVTTDNPICRGNAGGTVTDCCGAATILQRGLQKYGHSHNTASRNFILPGFEVSLIKEITCYSWNFRVLQLHPLKQKLLVLLFMTNGDDEYTRLTID